MLARFDDGSKSSRSESDGSSSSKRCHINHHFVGCKGAGGEGVHAGERHFLDGYYGSGLLKTLYGNPKWHEL